MLFPEEERKLKDYLALSPNPEDTFSYDELLGFLFGLAMTPETVPPEEWIPCIFGGDEPDFASAGEAEEMTSCLRRILGRLTDALRDNNLDFPIDIGNLDYEELFTVYEWVSGFDEALTMRASLWEPEMYPRLGQSKKEELYFSLMIIEGLVEPDQVMDFFDRLPEDFLRESFPGMDAEEMDREMQVQLFLLASLPLAVRTLQKHARMVGEKGRGGKKPVQLAAFRKKEPQESSCRCDSQGQPGSCCGDGMKRTNRAVPSKAKTSKVIKVDFPQHGPKTKKTAPLYQLKVNLQGTRPPIWRRLVVPGGMTLDQLHKVIQLCMGWTDSHFHQFLIDRTLYSLPGEDDLWETSRPKNEARFTLQTLDKKIRNGFQYIYDLGDDWLHQITVEKVLEPGQAKPIPMLISGRRACPPEEVGGVHGYLHLLDILSDPENDEYRQYRDWLGEEFAPERFGKEEISLINAVLKEIYA